MPSRPDTLVLRESLSGKRFLKNRSVVRGQLAPLLTKQPARIFYIGDQSTPTPQRWIESELRGAGYTIARRELHAEVILLELTR